MGKYNLKKSDSENFEKKLVQEVLDDFKQRQYDRKSFERTWQMNINFYLGNQYCSINKAGELIDNYKQYFWEERQVFNHIAPIIEIRMSKLGRVRPNLTVLPFSEDENDINCAKISKKILKAVTSNINLSKLLSSGTLWSEICGTVFYKVSWNSNAGKVIGVDENGVDIKEGDIEVSVVNPFEIYPDSNSYSNIDECKSIIHARAFHVDTVKNLWGVDVEGQDIDVFTLDSISNSGGLGYYSGSTGIGKILKKNHVIVIEKYEAPSVEYPYGRVILIAGDKLIAVNELPYINKDNELRGFPFVKQCSIPTPNCFWGTSIIERCIPVQRADNAVKNRKHEFLNRVSMGILTVEDGSVDTENLEEEGLSPGKVLIYRQGANSPKMLNTDSVPLDFQYEENTLLKEFLNISGVSDLFNGSNFTGNVSGVALQLLIEQDEARLSSCSEEIRCAAKEIAQKILKLYKQFAILPHSTRIVDESGQVELFYWKNSDLSCDEVVFETENETNETPAQKRSMIYEILNTGLLHDEEGKMSNSLRHKILQQLGFGIWEGGQDIKSLQINNADKENVNLIENFEISKPKDIDDHELHINAHICFMLSNEFERKSAKNEKLEKKLMDHIKQHKLYQNLTIQAENKI